jgi:hypothetical protein
MSKNQVLAFSGAESDGMTLRDYFAAAALTGLLAKKSLDDPSVDFEDFVGDAYTMADAMMDWRKE